MLGDEIRDKGIFKKMVKLGHLIENLIEESIELYPITFLEASILFNISKVEKIQYQIAKEYGISPQRMNQITTKLEKNKYIKKIEILHNGKKTKKMELTTQGREVLEKIMFRIEEKMSALGLQKTEFEVLNSAIDKILITFEN